MFLNRYFRIGALCLLTTCYASIVAAQTAIANNPATQSAPVYLLLNRDRILNANSGLRPAPDEIVQQFVIAETRFRERLKQFSFKRNVILQTIGPGGEVTGEYIRDSVFVLDDRGQVVEKVFNHPKPTLKGLTITKEDVQDLSGSQLFGLTDLNSYNLSYLGEETINGKLAYQIGVSPRLPPDPCHMQIRYFVGQVSVDAVSFQPVKLRGVTQPQGKQRFPSFETSRLTGVENLFFPSSAFADEVLHFPRKDVHYRINVRYYDFKRFSSQVKIVELD
jgi:hypothetical protein